MHNYLKKQQEDRQRFLRCTKNHRMTILQDDGLYRHIRVADPNSSNYHFNIATIPGYLFFTGDMGSFTFSRLRDMFGFHRINWDREVPTIDYRYWSEKCQAVDKYGGLTDFDEDAWKKCAVRAFREHEFPEGGRMDLWHDYRHEVLECSPSNSTEGVQMVMDWSYWDDSGTPCHPFKDFWDYAPFETPSRTLKWACWAIASTIRDYDADGDRHDRQAFHDKLILEGKL